MQTLNLYKERSYNQIRLFDSVQNKPVVFKIPNEFTVEEVERLYEMELMREKIEGAKISSDPKEKAKQLDSFWMVIFDELEVLFQHFHPEMTKELLKKSISYNDALELVGFYHKYRLQGKPGTEGSKKKL